MNLRWAARIILTTTLVYFVWLFGLAFLRGGIVKWDLVALLIGTGAAFILSIRGVPLPGRVAGSIAITLAVGIPMHALYLRTGLHTGGVLPIISLAAFIFAWWIAATPPAEQLGDAPAPPLNLILGVRIILTLASVYLISSLWSEFYGTKGRIPWSQILMLLGTVATIFISSQDLRESDRAAGAVVIALLGGLPMVASFFFGSYHLGVNLLYVASLVIFTIAWSTSITQRPGNAPAAESSLQEKERDAQTSARWLLAVGTAGLLLCVAVLWLFSLALATASNPMTQVLSLLMPYLVASSVCGMFRLPHGARMTGLWSHVVVALVLLLTFFGGGLTVGALVPLFMFVVGVGCYCLVWLAATQPGSHTESDTLSPPTLLPSTDAEAPPSATNTESM